MSKSLSGTGLSEMDLISNFRWFRVITGLWSLVAVSDVDNTFADSIRAKYQVHSDGSSCVYLMT